MVWIKKERVLLRPEDIRPSSEFFEVLGVINPAAVRLPNQDILLYVRVIEKLKIIEDDKFFYSPRMIGKTHYKLKIDKFPKKSVVENSELDFILKNGTKRLTFISHFRRVILEKEGFKIKHLSDYPDFFGLKLDGEFGVEDPRITKIGDKYVMAYVMLARDANVSVSYAISKDCLNWTRKGIIFGAEDKDVVFFPEMINKKYYAFDRPISPCNFSPPGIWISSSKDMENWGNPRPVKIANKDDWDYGISNGAGPPPIKTSKGWLLIYHAALEKYRIIKPNKFMIKVKQLFGLEDKQKITSLSYFAGAALFDLKNPGKMIAKSKDPIIYSDKKYEKGTFENKRVVFPTGVVLDTKKKNLLIYSGGGDIVTSVKKISLKSILRKLKHV